MKRAKRWVAIGLTAAFVAGGAEMVTPVTASAAQVDLVCQGITGDNASSLGDSAATLALLGRLGGGGSGLTFSAEITTNAPAKVSPNAGPFDATFNLTMTLPASLTGPAKSLLGLSSVEVSNATYAIQASGASDSNISINVPSQIIDLNAEPVVVSQTISGKIDPKKAGTIGYRPGANTQLSIVINKSVAGTVTVNTLTVTCGSTRDVAQTAVQIPGSPNVSQPIIQGAYTASIVGRPLMGQHITPDDNNPIIDGSLRLVNQSPVGGYSAVGGGAAFFLAPQEPGLYWVDYEVCANSRLVPMVPGVNTVQTVKFPESYQGKGLNAHPLSMRLSFKGEKTAPISLSSFLGQPSATTEALATNVDRFFAQFTPPSAATIRTALENLPNVGRGNVQVAGPTNGAYTITFVGALGKSEQPVVEVTDWESWLPASLLDTALGALTPAPPDPNAPTTTTAAPETVASLDAKLAAGQITLQQYIDGRLVLIRGDIIGGITQPAAIQALTALFPKAAEAAVVTAGSPEVPAYQTGPLCTPFQIGYWTVPNPARVLAATEVRYKTVTKCSTKRVKVKGKYVKKRTCRKVRVRA